MTLSNKEIQEKRAQAQKLPVLVHVGKAGITDALVAELAGHLKRQKLVKVRLLPAATGGQKGEEQAAALAQSTGSSLIEQRGRTAVYWKG